MKIKTEKLSGSALNWAVAKCQTSRYVAPVFNANTKQVYLSEGLRQNGICFRPLADWTVGGAMLESNRISTSLKHHGYWIACIYDLNDEPTYQVLGSTLLEAGLRCLVLSLLGDVVDIPDELAP